MPCDAHHHQKRLIVPVDEPHLHNSYMVCELYIIYEYILSSHQPTDHESTFPKYQELR